jgi:hypothetical protein
MKLSERQKLLRLWRYRWKRVVQFSDVEDEEEFSDIRAALEVARYLSRPVKCLSQHNSPELSVLLQVRRDYFRQQTRMCQETFLKLLGLIIDDPVFDNDSSCPQRHPGLQLYVYLQVVGHDGNGLVCTSIAGMQSISEGSVSTYTSRVCDALHGLKRKLLRWPKPSARARMSARFFEKFGFYCCGILDGTFVYFNQAPAIDPECFFTRKKKMYGVNCQLICDLDWRIIGFVVGWPGCTPDTTAYESSDFYKEQESYFTPGESVMADKGYNPRATVTVPYDEPEVVDTVHSTADRKREYNDGLKKGRLLIERVNAMLKNRFTWLKGMRLQVKKMEDFAKVNRMIIGLLILHNFMMSKGVRDVWSDVRNPECDEWCNQMSKAQAKFAQARAKATANLTTRDQDLLARVSRESQYLLWKDARAIDSYFAD